MKFRTLLLGHRDDHSKARLSSALDQMDSASRIWTTMSIEPSEQRELWKLFEDAPIDANHFVASGSEPMKEVIHHGRNTLPMHNFFQKRFCLADDESGEMWGYNHQSWSPITGPGYFVSHAVDRDKDKGAPSEYVIDYTRIPPKKPDSWPPILTNEKKLGIFIYSGMLDYMRKVSEHVSIGRAYKKGKPMNAWFILCREDPAS